MDGMVMTMLGWRRAGRRAVLHGRMLDRRLRQLRDLLLDLDETPEFARQEVDRSEIVLLRPQADFSDPPTRDAETATRLRRRSAWPVGA
jgi:hypothetical protein